MLVARCRYSAWSWRVAVGQRRLGLCCYLLYGYTTGCSGSGLRFAPLAATLLLIDPSLFYYRLQGRRLQGPSSLNPTAAIKCSAARAATGLGLVGRRIT